MIIHIVGGGPREFLPDLRKYEDNHEIFWITADRGTRYLLEAGITPNIAVGDFDSVTLGELDIYRQKVLNLQQYSSEKDETDMEIALKQALERKPQLIRIFGATGGRLDHFLANLFLLTKPKQMACQCHVQLIDKQNTAEIKSGGTYTIKKSDYQYISFIPISSKIEGFTLEGFKYLIKDGYIFRGTTLCISNELIQDYGTYSFSKGILLVVRANDE